MDASDTSRRPFAFIRAVALAAAVLTACNGGSGEDGQPCEDQEPAFVLTVTGQQQALPPSTTVTVRYGGSITEEYRLGQDGEGGPLVFCEEQPDLADAGAEVHTLVCALYTGQAAVVTLAADGYPTQTQLLTLEHDDQDCIVTHDEEMVLEPADAGT
jgi:hypothetical protein